MILCYLALGSNLRSPERQLRLGIQSIQSLPRSYVVAIAGFYKNPAVGRKTQPPFCNTVLALYTALSPKKLLLECQRIEESQGRTRRVKWGARTLDIDILLYGSKNISTNALEVPHPQMMMRDFVLVPLREIVKNKTASFAI